MSVLKKGSLLVVLFLPLHLVFAQEVEDFEFDPNLLMTLPNQPNIDIRRFNQRGAISAGTYPLKIHVNGKWRGNLEVPYLDDKQNLQHNAKLCIQENLLKVLDLKPDTLNKIQLQQNGCYEVGEVITDFQSLLDLSDMTLNISLPQIYLTDRPDDYIDPSMWDTGVNSAFISYQFNHYHTQGANRYKENYLGLNTGLNFGQWHLRHQSWARQNSQNKGVNYEALNTNISTHVPTLQGQLTLGDFYADGSLFEGNAIRGFRLSSDDRMLPVSLKDYAPTILGVAHSNAQVSVYQNNQEIYNTTVPAGAFELTNIKGVGSNGDLTVVITESDGRQTRQTIPYSSSISLLRPKHYRYDLSWGRLRYNNTHLYDDVAMQGTWQQGINNQWTLNTGFIYSPNYQSLLAGSAVNTKWGAFSLNAISTSTKNKLSNQSKDGYQLHAQYHRLIPATKTNIHASIRHYADYLSLEDALRFNYTRQNQMTSLPKQRYQISIHQPISSNWGSLYAFFSHITHHRLPSDRQWQVGYSNRLGSLSYGVSAQRTKVSANDHWDTQYMLTVSTPLGGHSHHLNGFYAKSGDSNQLHTGISGSVRDMPYFDYGVSFSHNDKPTQNSWSAHTNYQTAFAKLSGSYSRYEGGQQYSAGASGAIVIHEGGATASNQLGDTFAIMHLPHGKGATLEGNDKIRFNGRGYAIAPSLSAYRMNTLTINPSGLPYEVQLSATGSQLVPVAGASALVKFNSTVGRMVLLNVKQKDGSYPMMGANVMDEQMNVVSFVAQDGRIFLQNAKDGATLSIRWGDGKDEMCHLSYNLPKDTTNTPISTINTTCH